MKRAQSPTWFALVALACAVACGSSDDGDSPDAQTAEPLYSFAVITDTHIPGDADNATRLTQVVDAINAEAAARQIELVLVLGDIGWGPPLANAKRMLDELAIPYVPLLGDNEIHGGSEEGFENVFAPQFAQLETALDNWHKVSVPVWNPEAERDSWFQNFSFDYRGVHFIIADWNARGVADWAGELGFLHDFDGGTWPWFEAELAAYEGTTLDSVVIASHIPMHSGPFEREKMQPIETLIAEHQERVYGNLAGHVHLSYEVDVAGIYDVFVTAATWNDDDPLRIVTVAREEEADQLVYAHELIYVPF